MKIFLSLLMLLSVTSLAYPAAISLRWDANTESDLAGYNVYCSSNNTTSFVIAGTTTDTFLTINVPKPDLGSSYYFVATAFNTTALESSYSNVVTVTRTLPTPNQPVLEYRP